MPNTNYRSGVRWEREVKKRYEKEGWTVMRSSGSHGCFDLCCFHPELGVMGVQCKRTKDKTAARALIRNLMEFPPMPRSKYYLQKLEIYISSTRERLSSLL